MFAYAAELVERAERAASAGQSPWPILRQLPLDDFGDLLISIPNHAFPGLSRALPAMASDEVQRNWTGNCGEALLRQTNAFSRIVAQQYSSLTGRGLSEARILDFGCGYGRIMRAMYKFTAPENVFGCDPWDVSVDLCREANLPSAVEISDYLPDTLPFEGQFDLSYAFSVFTHLSERAARSCMNVLADHLSKDGVLAVTIRPIEYWRERGVKYPQAEIDQFMLDHESNGFAFVPHRDRAPVDGDITFGETSMSVEFLASLEPRLGVRAIERSKDDPFQMIVFMTPA